MSEPEELRRVATYILKWNALSDACKKCQSLNQREYDDQRIYQDTVWDGQWGNIWDLNADHSLAHPNCRCQLTVRVEFDWTKAEWFGDIQVITHRLRRH